MAKKPRREDRRGFFASFWRLSLSEIGRILRAVFSEKNSPMISFLIHRLFQSLLVLVVMSFVIYLLIGLAPGDPIDMMLTADPRLGPADAVRLRALYGLDAPIAHRYLNWLLAALSGDFGHSRLFGRPVFEVLIPRLGNTLALMGAGLTLALAIAVPVGVAAARRPGSTLDGAINIICFMGISIPSFWLALVLILLFAVTLGWLPAGGNGVAGGDAVGGSVSLGQRLSYMVLPVATLTLSSVAGYTRYVRSAMREVLRQDFIRTARAKGLGERWVVWRHGVRNALIPVVTILGLEVGSLFSGALITETMFSWPGMGKLIFDAVMGNDYNLALVALLLATAMTLLGNLAADVGYAFLDPRIHFGERRT
ncbi:Oligopeptide transport system permease protein AppB [Azospirillaceae bacterium]